MEAGSRTFKERLQTSGSRHVAHSEEHRIEEMQAMGSRVTRAQKALSVTEATPTHMHSPACQTIRKQVTQRLGEDGGTEIPGARRVGW